MASTDHIDLNLDTAERPADQVRPDFAFTWKDRRIVLTDPANVDYRSLLEVDSPVGFLKYTARQEDRDFLASRRAPWRGGASASSWRSTTSTSGWTRSARSSASEQPIDKRPHTR